MYLYILNVNTFSIIKLGQEHIHMKKKKSFASYVLLQTITFSFLHFF